MLTPSGYLENNTNKQKDTACHKVEITMRVKIGSCIFKPLETFHSFQTQPEQRYCSVGAQYLKNSSSDIFL